MFQTEIREIVGNKRRRQVLQTVDIMYRTFIQLQSFHAKLLQVKQIFEQQ